MDDLERSPARARRAGVVLLAVLGPLAVLAAATLRRAVDAAVARPEWWALEAWLPSPLPSTSNHEAPWPVLLPALALATMALVAAGLAALVLARGASRPRLARFALGWVVTGLAAAAMVAAVQYGELVSSIALVGGRGGYHLRTETLPALREVLVWTGLWGWLPALVAALGGGPRATATPHPGRWRVVGLALLAAALATGVGASEVARRASAWTESRPVPPATATAAPTNPPAGANPSVQPRFEGRCEAAALTLDYGFTDASLGARTAEVTAVNASDTACSLEGFPDLAFADARGNALSPRVVTGGSAERVRLAPGGSRSSELTWRAGVAAGEPSLETLLVAPWPGATRVGLAASGDIGDATEVTLSAWR